MTGPGLHPQGPQAWKERTLPGRCLVCAQDGPRTVSPSIFTTTCDSGLVLASY